MKRPLCVIGSAYALATWAAFLLDWRATLPVSVVICIAGAVAIPIRRLPTHLCAALLAAALGLGGYSLHYQLHMLPLERYEGEEVAVEGLVTWADYYGRTNTARIKAVFPDNPDLPGGVTLLVRQYGESELAAGETVRCTVRITPRVKKVRRVEQIVANGVVNGPVVAAEKPLFPVDRAALVLRQRLRANLYRVLEGDAADVVAAMVLGLQQEVSDEVYTHINRSGASHLLTVSGLHLSVVTSLVALALTRMGAGRRTAGLVSIGAALGFLLLVGATASLTRAFVMTAIVLLAQVISRRGDSLNALGLAVLVCCAARPHWITGRGMWLSVAATLGIIILGRGWAERLTAWGRTGSERLNRLTAPLWTALGISAGAYLFTLPVALVCFGWISLVAPLTNLYVAPLVLPLMAGGMLCAVFGGVPVVGGLAAAVCRGCVELVLRISALFGGLPFATRALDQLWLVIWVVAVAAGLLLLLWWRADRRLWGPAAALCALVFCVGSLSGAVADNRVLQVVSLQNSSVLVAVRGREALLLGSPTRYDASRLCRYLDFRGVGRIRAVICPDYGEQVDSGILRLAERYRLDCVIGPDDGYILGQLELALGDGVEVQSAGYARIALMEDVWVQAATGGGLVLTAGEHTLRKGAVALPAARGEEEILVGPQGEISLPPGMAPLVEPVGAAHFGETRLELKL